MRGTFRFPSFTLPLRIFCTPPKPDPELARIQSDGEITTKIFASTSEQMVRDLYVTHDRTGLYKDGIPDSDYFEDSSYMTFGDGTVTLESATLQDVDIITSSSGGKHSQLMLTLNGLLRQFLERTSTQTATSYSADLNDVITLGEPLSNSQLQVSVAGGAVVLLTAPDNTRNGVDLNTDTIL